MLVKLRSYESSCDVDQFTFKLNHHFCHFFSSFFFFAVFFVIWSLDHEYVNNSNVRSMLPLLNVFYIKINYIKERKEEEKKRYQKLFVIVLAAWFRRLQFGVPQQEIDSFLSFEPNQICLTSYERELKRKKKFMLKLWA